MNELALFAGAGGGILGGSLLGWRTVCAVEINPYARQVLLARQADGCLPRFPIWDDITTFDGTPWRGHVDIVSGGFPCQDISAAGKGAGITGERSGLWKEMARIVGEVRPSFVWVENSPLLVDRGLAVVLGDLAQMGYDARWGVVGAHHAGAPHRRDRLWILAYPKGASRPLCNRAECFASGSISSRRCCFGKHREMAHEAVSGCIIDPTDEAGKKHNGLWASEPSMGRMVDGLASKLDLSEASPTCPMATMEEDVLFRNKRLYVIGNGQVPLQMAYAWKVLMELVRF